MYLPNYLSSKSNDLRQVSASSLSGVGIILQKFFIYHNWEKYSGWVGLTRTIEKGYMMRAKTPHNVKLYGGDEPIRTRE